MQRALALLLALTLSAAAPQPAQAAEPLRVALLSSGAAPFVVRTGPNSATGLDLEVARLLAEPLGLAVQAVLLPAARVRLAAAAGEIDLLCGLDPQRLVGADGFEWSPVLGEVGEVLLGHRAADPVDQLDQLPSSSVLGLVLGQSYPALAEGLAAGRWQREDALGEDRLVRKLAAQRHPYAVLSALTPRAEAQLGALGLENLAEWRLPLGGRRYQCGVPGNGRVAAARLWQVLQAQRTALAERLAPALQAPLAVVVSRHSPLRVLTERDLVDLYLGRRTRLADGSLPRLTLLRGERAAFLRQLGLEPAEVAARWAALQFGGRNRAPEELADAAALKSRLRADPLALGFLPLSAVDAQLRVVHMR